MASRLFASFVKTKRRNHGDRSIVHALLALTKQLSCGCQVLELLHRSPWLLRGYHQQFQNEKGATTSRQLLGQQSSSIRSIPSLVASIHLCLRSNLLHIAY